MTFSTCDLYDAHAERLSVVAPHFQCFGGREAFAGVIVTVKCFEDNSRVKEILTAEPGAGKVLVVDGGGSERCALLGDLIAGAAVERGWGGILVHGCVRDVRALAALDLGVYALNRTPRKSVRRGEGQRDLDVTFAGATFHPGDHLYADADGILVSPTALT